ncbi:MAG: hypothetical protein IJT73_10060, partial [Selenomonadaceae bacterium]|nr:hypothetical protein [Selenomonadaceae bacterium]
NVLLLSINQNMGVENTAEDEENESSVNPETQAISSPSIATVALHPDEILQLVSASRIGEIYLMLRPLVPQSNYYTGAEYTVESLKGQRQRYEQQLAKEEKERQAELERQAEIEKQVEQTAPAQAEEKPAKEKPRIKIYYGDEEGLKDTNENIPDDNNEKNKE